MAIKSTKKIILRLDPSYKKCPSCGEVNTLRRSRAKTFFENLLKVTGIYKMYRCRKCNWRGPLSTIVITAQTMKNLLIYVLVLLFTLYLISHTITQLSQ
jgi:predicted RNA-binding Zn-ribbon protein involved in translation (DUF1610 family)